MVPENWPSQQERLVFPTTHFQVRSPVSFRECKRWGSGSCRTTAWSFYFFLKLLNSCQCYLDSLILVVRDQVIFSLSAFIAVQSSPFPGRNNGLVRGFYIFIIILSIRLNMTIWFTPFSLWKVGWKNLQWMAPRETSNPPYTLYDYIIYTPENWRLDTQNDGPWKR